MTIDTNSFNRSNKFLREIANARSGHASLSERLKHMKASESYVEDIEGKFTSIEKTVENILKELFTYAGNGKEAIATAIAGLGLSASSSNTFAELADMISQGGLARQILTTKLNVTAPYIKDIVLTKTTPIRDLCTMVLQYELGPDIVHYQCNFDNTDASNFLLNDKVEFDGTMKLKNIRIYPTTNIDGIDESAEIDLDDFQSMHSIVYSDTNVEVTGTPRPQLVVATGDIDLTGIETLDFISWVATATGSSKALLLMSFDSGLTWKSHNGVEWIVVDINNTTNIESNGMPKSVVDSLTSEIIEVGRNGSTKLRFAYYMNQESVLNTVNTDSISIGISMPGYNTICDKAKYDIAYNEDTNTITYTFNTSGTYTINYND